MDRGNINIRVTNRYKLTGFSESDYDQLYEMATTPGFLYTALNAAPDGAGGKMPVEQSVRVYLDRMLRLNREGEGTTCYFAIRDTENNDRLVGSCNLRQTEHPGQAVFGIFIHPEYQCRKVGRRAALQMVRYAIENFSLTSLYATIDPLNTGSKKVCHTLGLKTPEGYVSERESKFYDLNGKLRPRLVYTANLNDINAALARAAIFLKEEPTSWPQFIEGLKRENIVGMYSYSKPAATRC